MARQYLIPGIGYVNESGTKDYLVPGSIYLNESVSGGGTTPLTVSLSDTISFSDSIGAGFGFGPLDTNSLSDGLLGGVGFSASDSYALSETLGGAYRLLISDAITFSDAANTFLISNSLTLGVSDTISFSESIAAKFGLLPSDTNSLLDPTFFNLFSLAARVDTFTKFSDTEIFSDSAAYTLAVPSPSSSIYQLLYSGLNDLAS